jgi:hypothetical protein
MCKDAISNEEVEGGKSFSLFTFKMQRGVLNTVHEGELFERRDQIPLVILSAAKDQPPVFDS